MEGQKFNGDKLPMDIVICKQFPDALKAIAQCTEYGHQKYIETDEDYQNFRKVPGGSQTYADALLRHSMEPGNDPESGLPHKYHKAWNALAELELWLVEEWANNALAEVKAKKKEDFTYGL